ncbi:MAG: hypothetical protein GXP29_12120 [Planctomycetes bacterium]|nr:hypothetical protein [Planctomycetota bacterium]
MWPIKTCIFLAGFVGSCGMSLVFPIVGVITYMMIYQMNPDDTWWGKPFEDWGLRLSLTAAVCMILGMLLSSARVPRSKQVVGDWLMLLVMFTTIVLGSLWIGTSTSDYGDMLADKMVKMTIFLFCMVRMGGTGRNFRFVLWAFAVGTLLIGYEAYNAAPSDFADGRLNFIGGPDFRESSGLAVHMAAMLPLLGVLFLTSRKWRWKAFVLVAGVLAVNTIIQCRTRSAFVGLVIGAVVGIFFLPRKRRLSVGASIVVAVAGMLALTDQHFWDRMRTILGHEAYAEQGAIQARIELWSIGWKMFLEHPFGVGIGQFKQAIASYNTGTELFAFSIPRRVTHNSYLLCMTELGVQGILVLGSLLALSFWKLRQCCKWAKFSADPSETRLLAFGCLLSILIYTVAAGFTDRLYTESFWWILALPVCLERAVAQKCKAQVEEHDEEQEAESIHADAPASDDSPPVRSESTRRQQPRNPMFGPVRQLSPMADRWDALRVGSSRTERSFGDLVKGSASRARRVAKTIIAGQTPMSAGARQPERDTIAASVELLLGDETGGARMFDLEEGVGKRATRAESVTVSYRGQFASGVLLDEAVNTRLNLIDIMPDLSRAIRTMREAGRRRVVIPPSDACDETIIFDVTLLKVHG